MEKSLTQPVGKLTPKHIELASMYSTIRMHYYTHAKAQKMERDPHRGHRLSIRECVPCYYNGSVYTEETVSATCQHCGNMFQHHHRGVPAYCEACSSAHGVCRHCGARLANRAKEQYA